MKGFRYYLKVWVAILKASFYKGSLYRMDSMARLVRALILLVIQVLFIKSIFLGGQKLAGWSNADYYLLVGTFDIVNYIGWGIFSVNLWRLEEKLHKGEFDFAMIKPTGNLFMAAFSEFFLDDFLPIISGLVLVGYWVVLRWEVITLSSLIGFLITILSGLVIWFAIQLIIASVNFISNKNGLLDLMKSITSIASYPAEVFGKGFSYIFYTFLPLAFVAAVPARVLSGFSGWEFVGFSCVIAVGLLLAAIFIWFFASRRYVSNGG